MFAERFKQPINGEYDKQLTTVKKQINSGLATAYDILKIKEKEKEDSTEADRKRSALWEDIICQQTWGSYKPDKESR